MLISVPFENAHHEGEHFTMIWFISCHVHLLQASITNTVNVAKHRCQQQAQTLYLNKTFRSFFFIPAGITITYFDDLKGNREMFYVHWCCWITYTCTHTMSLSLSDTCLLIILQYSLLPLKTPIKYEWVSPPLLFWLYSAEHQPPQSSPFMMLSCHQLDLIWSAPSPATRSDGAVCRWWWQRDGIRPSATC